MNYGVKSQVKIERVIIDSVGKIRLELHAPFTYLRDISDVLQTWEVSLNPLEKHLCPVGILNIRR